MGKHCYVFFLTVYIKNHKLFRQDTRHPYSYASGPYASTLSIYKFDRPFEDQNRFTCNVIYETNIGPFRPSVGKPAALSTRLRYVQFVILYLYFTVQIKTESHQMNKSAVKSLAQDISLSVFGVSVRIRTR
jgi:hypothetical protein